MMYFEMGGSYLSKGVKYFKRNIRTTPDGINNVRAQFNNTDVYSTVFQYDNENQDESNFYGPMYIDLDMDFYDNESFESLKMDLIRLVTYLEINYGIPKDYIRYFFTGKKGFHLLISPIILGIKPMKDLNIYYKKIANELKATTINKIVDTQIYDNKRLLRLVNSINGKSGLYKVPLTYQDILDFNYDAMVKYASEPRQIEYSKVSLVHKANAKFLSIIDSIKKEEEKKKKKFAIPVNVDLSKITFTKCIKNIYAEGAASGGRNNTTVILASAYLQKGIDYNTTLQMIHKWNIDKNDPPLSERELEVTVKSAYDQIQNGRIYGCSSIKNLGLCVGKECKLYK